MNFALVILPTLILTYYLPLVAMMYWPTLSGRESWLWLWQMFPVWMFLATRLVSSFVEDTTVTDRFEAPERDMPVIRYTIRTLIGVSATVWGLTTFLSQSGLWNIFIPQSLPSQTTTLAIFTREFLKFDEVFLFGNTFLWLGMLFWDLKHAGMVEVGWARLLICLVGLVLVLGPGATAGLMWLWREEVLASRRHKDAVFENGMGEI